MGSRDLISPLFRKCLADPIAYSRFQAIMDMTPEERRNSTLIIDGKEYRVYLGDEGNVGQIKKSRPNIQQRPTEVEGGIYKEQNTLSVQYLSQQLVKVQEWEKEWRKVSRI